MTTCQRPQASRSLAEARRGAPAGTSGAERSSLASGDVYLLCTDGLWQHMDPAGAGERFFKEDAETALNEELKNALESGKPGHRDNISAILVQFRQQ